MDGGIDIYHGVVSARTVHQLDRVAHQRLAELKHQGLATPAARADYQQVERELRTLRHHAVGRDVRGGAKVVFGGMLIASPFTGPAAPIVGGVGAVGYLGTTIWGHFHP
ncbi:MAG: hypothetical protein ACYCW6_26320 [Candidatus Xenobia bacterium]